MARTVAQIQAKMIADISSNPNLNYVDDNGITRNITYNTSARAIWRNITFIVAAAIAVFEQLQDLYLAAVEAQVAQSAAASTLWVQAKMFAFQYSATNPQIIQLINTVPQYPVVNSNLCIITACSVTSTIPNVVNIKVAKGDTYTQLAPLELSAAQSYINLIGDAGINYNVTSAMPDLLYVDATVYYQGMYSNVIQTNVNNAIVNFLQTLSQTNFDGSLKMSDLEQTLRSVAGVNDVVLNNVICHAAGTSLNVTNGPFLVLNKTVVQRLWNPVAGYIVVETDTSNNLNHGIYSNAPNGGSSSVQYIAQ